MKRPYDYISPVEKEILTLLSEGKNIRQVAQARFTTVGTLKIQLGSLRRKVGAKNTIHLMNLYFYMLETGDDYLGNCRYERAGEISAT